MEVTSYKWMILFKSRPPPRCSRAVVTNNVSREVILVLLGLTHLNILSKWGLGHRGAWAFLPLQFWREVFSISLRLNSFWVVHHCCGGWPVVIQPKYAKHARPPLAEGQRYQIIFSSSAAPSWIGVGAGVWVVCKYVGDGIP